jgi:ABC-type dipeptide/oligopeptide/nickel transport system permease component
MTGLIRYIGQRLQTVPIVLLLVSTVVFAIMHILPGDPVQLMLSGAESGAGSPEQLAEIRERLGLEDPLYVQYARYMFNAMQGDLGTSIRFNSPVSNLVIDAAAKTFVLSIAGLIVALLIGIPLGIIAALYQDTWVDTLCMVIALFAVSMPLFWFGQILIFGFAIRLAWLPAISGTQPTGLILPAFTIGAIAAGLISRLTRSTLSEVLNEDYVRTARAKGLRERRVVLGHAFKNAIVPVITIVGLQFGAMLSGAVIVETVFSRPGLGSLVVNAILWKDYPLVQGTVFFIAVSYVLVNLLVDVFYAWMDPRIHYS